MINNTVLMTLSLQLNRTVKLIGIICCLVCCKPQTSQAQVSDFGAWTTFSLEKKINKKFSANITEELRFFQNLNRFNLSYTNVGLSYKWNKAIKLSLVYRFIQKYTEESYVSWRHRIYIDLQVKQKYYPLTVVYRSRLQSQVRDFNSSIDGKIPERYWRNKFDVRYEIGRFWSPYIAAEFRYQFINDRNKEANSKFNRGRYYAGVQYQYSERTTLDFYFMNQREFNVNNPERNYIIGAEWDYSF